MESYVNVMDVVYLLVGVAFLALPMVLIERVFPRVKP